MFSPKALVVTWHVRECCTALVFSHCAEAAGRFELLLCEVILQIPQAVISVDGFLTRYSLVVSILVLYVGLSVYNRLTVVLLLPVFTGSSSLLMSVLHCAHSGA